MENEKNEVISDNTCTAEIDSEDIFREENSISIREKYLFALQENEELSKGRATSLTTKKFVLLMVLVFFVFAVSAGYFIADCINGIKIGMSYNETDYSYIPDTDIDFDTDTDIDTDTDTDTDDSLIVQYDKPYLDSESVYVDENGRYTTEGVAMVVRPSVVDILIYNEEDELSSSGSGIIMSETGYIVTNAHVISDACRVEVVLYNGDTYDAEIIGKDVKTDIGVVKSEADGLIPAEFGYSESVNLGEAVVAIGNPAGLSGSISSGIVSGLNRRIRVESTGYVMNCIQTDAAISPGNSGGALVNMYGQVIGITSSKYVSSSYEGIGFALTIDEVKPIIDEIVSQGYISGRYRIGITFFTVTESISEEYDVPMGLLVSEISPDCDISNTKLEAGDIITHIEGKEIYSYDSLVEAIGDKGANDIITAGVSRLDSETMEVTETFEISFMLMPDTSGNY